MVDLLDLGYALPCGVEPVEPNLIRVLQPVVVNVQIPNGWCDFLRRAREIICGCGRIPSCIRGRAAGKLTSLLDGNERRSLEKWYGKTCGRCCECCRRSGIDDRLRIGGSTGSRRDAEG